MILSLHTIQYLALTVSLLPARLQMTKPHKIYSYVQFFFTASVLGVTFVYVYA